MRWISRTKQAALVAVGTAIGFNGLVVAVAPGRIGDTYGVTVDGPDDELLLRHRAVLLALVGSLLVTSAFRRELRSAAVPAAALSAGSYALFGLLGEVGPQQRRVALGDVALLVVLAAATAVPDRAGARREAGRRTRIRSWTRW